jgi:hypothetical protein
LLIQGGVKPLYSKEEMWMACREAGGIIEYIVGEHFHVLPRIRSAYRKTMVSSVIDDSGRLDDA